MTRKILIVEDDPATARQLQKTFSEAGFTSRLASDGQEALYHAADKSFDVIVLDRLLPNIDGVGILKAVRAANVMTPVILLTALTAIEERVTGLEAGADDYLVKPFASSELLARVNVLLRRKAADAAPVTKLMCGDLTMDLVAHGVSRGGKRIDLREREFRLLAFFLRHQDELITRTMLLEGVWNHRFDPDTNVIEVHVSNLRQRIDRGFDKPLLHSIRGAGYMLSNKR
jgi:two-component system OmpR family response regulator